MPSGRVPRRAPGPSTRERRRRHRPTVRCAELPSAAQVALVQWRSEVAARFRGCVPPRTARGSSRDAALFRARAGWRSDLRGLWGGRGEPVVGSAFGEGCGCRCGGPACLRPARSMMVRAGADPVRVVRCACRGRLVRAGIATSSSPMSRCACRLGDARIRRVELPAPPESRVRLLRSDAFAGSRSGLWARGTSCRARVELGSAPGAADPTSVARRFHAVQAKVLRLLLPLLLLLGPGLGSMRDVLSEDVVWHAPGASAIAGEHRGVDAVLEYLDTRRRMTDSTSPRDRSRHGDDRRARRPAAAGGRASREGREVCWETVGVLPVTDGRIAERAGWCRSTRRSSMRSGRSAGGPAGAPRHGSLASGKLRTMHVVVSGATGTIGRALGAPAGRGRGRRALPRYRPGSPGARR